MMDAMLPPTIRCPDPDCKTASKNLRDFTGHLRSAHSLERGLLIVCPVLGCTLQYLSQDGFRKHLDYRHRQLYLASRSNSVHDRVQPAQEFESVSEVDMGAEEPFTSAESFECIVDSLPKQSRILRLKVEHVYDIPTSTAASVFDEVISFALMIQRQMFDVILLRLKELNVRDEDLSCFLDINHLERALRNPRAGCEATLRDLGYVKPQPFDLLALAADEVQPPQVSKGRPVMHYIPILKNLRTYLAHEDVMSAILRENFVDHDNLSSYVSASHFKNHPFFSVHPKALRLVLYTDELEVCNPLGGNQKKHKICGVYYQVMNIGAKHLSSLYSVHLALLVKWHHVQRFGYEVVLKPLLADLKLLFEVGIDVRVKGGGTNHFLGAVALVVGDNLSLHMLGGFRRCFSSGKVCRFCLADYKELPKLKHEGMCSLRSDAIQRRHVELVADDPSAEAVYGVRGSCPLTCLPYIQVPECMPPDVMHDILEKFMTLNVKIVLKGLHINKQVLFPTTLDKMSAFKYSSLDKINKHPPLSPDLLEPKNTIKGSAAQKWHLFYFLSLMLGPHVSETSKFWKLHLLANRICDIILAMSVSKEMVVQLCMLLTEHHNLWVRLVKKCYPPKLHYLLHYARLMLIYGPLRLVWCMRFEAFHQSIKRMSQKSNNFVNPTATQAARIQKKKCLLFSGGSALPPRFVIQGKQSPIYWNNLSGDVQDSLSKVCPVDKKACFLRVKSVTVHGLHIQEGSFNIIDVIDGDVIFLKVTQIFIMREEVCVVGRKVFPLTFNNLLHAFQIPNNGASNMVCVMAENLFPAQTLSSYKVGDSTFIKVRFTPCRD